MAMNEKDIAELNNFLEAEQFDIDAFGMFFQFLKQNHSFKINLIDFEYYNEQRLEEAKKEKISSVQHQNWEIAASNRDLELLCQKFIDIRNQFNIEKSFFLYEEDYLLYLFLGTARNDKWVREYLKL